MKQKLNYGHYSIIFLAILCIVFIFFMCINVEIEGDFNCDTGFIGLDVELYNNIQNKTCDFDGNYTCFKENLQIKYLKIKDIDGLNCRGNTKMKLPLLFAIFMED